MTEVESAMIRLAADFRQFQNTVRERIMPPVMAFGHEMHAWWFETLPWHRRWWHVMTAHRHGLSEFTGRNNNDAG